MSVPILQNSTTVLNALLRGRVEGVLTVLDQHCKLEGEELYKTFVEICAIHLQMDEEEVNYWARDYFAEYVKDEGRDPS
jgi:hypothetical protein